MLLTAQDISDRARYLNAKNVAAALKFDVMPIVNKRHGRSRRSRFMTTTI
jgi:glutamate 5-kinase